MNNQLDPALDTPAGYTLRPEQVDAISKIIHYWDNYDTFVLVGPPGSGKSVIGATLANWYRRVKAPTESVAIITPQVMLQEQYADTLPIHVLKGKDRYQCVNSNKRQPSSCGDHFDLTEHYCTGCPYSEARKKVATEPITAFNFHSYYFHFKHDGTHPNFTIIDEAHKLVGAISDFYSLKVWRDQDAYPDKIETHMDIVGWLDERIPELQAEKAEATGKTRQKIARTLSKYELLHNSFHNPAADFLITEGPEKRYSKQVRCLNARPTSLIPFASRLWKSKKYVLMSATINSYDIKKLGLQNRRVYKLEIDSAIPVASRPFIFMPTTPMYYNNRFAAVPKLCAALRKLAAKHDTKGIVHIPYNLGALCQKELGKDPRFLFHTQKNKQAVYDAWRLSDTNQILMASGMAEGIDLAGENYKWQVILKLMRPSLGDELVQREWNTDKDAYDWETIKTTVQQYGRICRGPLDSGITYILDSSFLAFFRKTKSSWPVYFQQAVQLLELEV